MGVLNIAGRQVELVVRRHPRARRLTLSACGASNSVSLTLPPRLAMRDALAFLDSRRPWLEAQILSRWPAPQPIGDGGTVRFHGTALTIRHAPGRFPTKLDGHTLWVSGAPEAVPGRVLRWLRGEAVLAFEAEARRLAALTGQAVNRVSVGDPARRWGSCSSRGDIRLSWRLIMAPRPVWQGVVAHEVAHLTHQNHGEAFWALAEQLSDAEVGQVRGWLREHGLSLHAVGA